MMIGIGTPSSQRSIDRPIVSFLLFDVTAENPREQGTFHCLSTARQCHVLQRSAPQLLWIGYPLGGQGDERAAKRDFQFLGVVADYRHMGIERRPYSIECLFERPKKLWAVAVRKSAGVGHGRLRRSAGGSAIWLSACELGDPQT